MKGRLIPFLSVTRRKSVSIVACLNGKQLADQPNEFTYRMIAAALFLREVLFGLNQVTSSVRPASEVRQLVCSGDFVVRLVANGMSASHPSSNRKIMEASKANLEKRK
ncbi:hypothetical protein AXG89_41590 (plasmid) [Burkholderia sp. PAMC 26561]|nr:hypothetical protein AXG89_41465 [Burkholderia sp. PAMC 26561]AMH42819.1 hypothetical protein AXG89_41590 [Burkholderia sp. PAMC 26561]